MNTLASPAHQTSDHGEAEASSLERRIPGGPRTDMLVLAGLAAVAFAVQSLAWPLSPGRDTQSYLTYYLEIGSADPVFPQNMLFRAPVAPLFNGLALDLGGAGVAEALLGVLYVASVLAAYRIGSYWSRSAGLVSAVALVLYPSYGAMFHQVSSDALFAFGLIVWVLFICRTAASPTAAKFALNGLVLFLLVLVRPSAVGLLPVFAALSLLLDGRLRERLRNAAVFAVTALTALAGWAAYNELRYDDFTISRLSPVQLPLYRTLIIDRIVEPGNGSASRDLVRAVDRDLLRRDPYRSYGVTRDELLQSFGGWSALPTLADRTWGWDSDYGKLRAVALEAIARHPSTYARGVVKTVRRELSAPYRPTAPQAPPPPRTIPCELGCAGPGLKRINGRLLPPPVDEGGQGVPQHFAFWYESTPDGSIRTDWSSLAHPKLVFRDPDVGARYKRLAADLREMMSKLPSRDGSYTWSGRLNKISRWFPSMPVWLALGILGFALRPQRHPRLVILLAGLGLGLVVGTALGSPSSPLYRLPTDPLYIVSGVAALVGSGPGVRSWVKRMPLPRRLRAA